MNRYRIYYARDLLQYTALPIKEVASQVGIRQESFFSRLFRQKTGHSPRQFRREFHARAPTPLVDKPDPWKALQQMRVRGHATTRIRGAP
ncbi:MAG: helix-turn-helix domain-containing protein [Verrucomicrobia bacterium]|nr:helix-turn-helix domain-containing protein [Verrucomicrobiota bacterium]